MGTIVVNDTNIFIDLISVDLLDEFFSLPIDIHTTDFVVHELTEPLQQKKVESYIRQNKLTVKLHSAIEVIEIAEFQTTCENNGKHSKKCTFYTLRFGCSFAAVNTIKPQLL